MVGSLESMRLPVMLGLIVPIFAILAWLKVWWKLAARAYYTLVIIAIHALIWWAHYWNLIGLRI